MFPFKISKSLIDTIIVGLVIALFAVVGSLFPRSTDIVGYPVISLKAPHLYSEHQYQLDVVDGPESISEPVIQPTCSLHPPKIDCKTKSCVALTFDDGPGEYTSRLLDYLRDNQVRATFYMIGVYVEKYPEVVKRIAKERHQIGNHTWLHKNLTKMTDQEVKDSLTHTDKAIYDVSGVVPTTLRPPFGETDDRVANISGKSQILWSVDATDWLHRDTKSTIDNVLNSSSQGSIILLHDIYPSTIDAIPEIIKGLRAKGFEMATVDELLGNMQVKSYHRQ